MTVPLSFHRDLTHHGSIRAELPDQVQAPELVVVRAFSADLTPAAVDAEPALPSAVSAAWMARHG